MSFPNTANWFLSIVLLGSVTLTPISVAAVYGNRMGEQFTFAPEYLQELSDAIREHGGNGRTFVASFILHELGAKEYNTQDGGHVAPLPLFSGKSMYAFDYYHSRWSYVDPIPVSFRNRGSEGIEEFLDLINASSVITFTKKWRDYCLKNPRYQEVLFVNRFRLFVRKPAENGFFLKGNGRIVEKNNGLSIYPQSEEVIIKFRYLPKLRVYPPEAAELSPYLTFIEDIGGGKTEEVYYIRMNVRDTFLNSDREIFVGY